MTVARANPYASLTRNRTASGCLALPWFVNQHGPRAYRKVM